MGMILLNTMPKSGSVYILKSLAKIVNLKTMHFGDPSNGRISTKDVAAFSAGGFVAQNHLDPSADNLQILEQLKPRMVLHLRDPRQAMLSWLYHLDWKNRTEGLVLSGQPAGYYEWPLPRKIDWQIDNYLPRLLAWTKQWVAIADKGTFPILITHQDDLRCNEKAFFDAILSFYEMKLDFELPNLARTLDETHFRNADPEEWVRTFTSEQADRTGTALPRSLKMRFGWSNIKRQVAA